NRPLWELYLVEGLARNRFALITKTHHAMIDGIGAIEIGQVILDVTANPADDPERLWMPEPERSQVQLVTDAVSEVVQRPAELVENVRSAVEDVASLARRAFGVVSGVTDLLTSAVRP